MLCRSPRVPVGWHDSQRQIGSPFSIGGGMVDFPGMTAAKETTLRELGEMLQHVVDHMATKEDVGRLDTRIDDFRAEMIDQFEHADKQFQSMHDRLGDIAAEIAVIHRRI
jgi:hypothetical protein